MRKTIVIILALVSHCIANAQQAETIESITANSHEPEWYAAQAEAWQKRVDENPQDQWAWRNLFRATCYYEQFTGGWGENQDESRTADVIRRMEAALPDSFVLNLCKGRFCLTTDVTAKRGDNILRAIELMPENICPEDLEFLAVRLWINDPENPRVKELYTKSYQSRYFPSRHMHFNHNMLQSMEPNALYFSNGDLDTEPMKMLQEALGERTDVIIINLSFLHATTFMDALYKKLNIAPLTLNVQDYGDKYGEKWLQYYEADIIMYLIKESKRPAYFSPTNPKVSILDTDSIFNEGLVLKYSPKPYNNFDVAMHNVKEVYNLEYLAEPDLVYDSWETSAMVDLNHVTLLAHLIAKFRKKGDEHQAMRLYNILSKCAERCVPRQSDSYSQEYPIEDRKAYYENLLKKQLQ
ncbi:MAG: hypothetical protein IJQ59_00915 [Bacteroidaceae bacterium]|nr:hypothetical protein [Bacteroidaceae bacterium]